MIPGNAEPWYSYQSSSLFLILLWFLWKDLNKDKQGVQSVSKTCMLKVNNKFIEITIRSDHHCIKYARMRVFTDPYFPVQGQNLLVVIREKTGQQKSVCWHILCSAWLIIKTPQQFKFTLRLKVFNSSISKRFITSTKTLWKYKITQFF